MKAIQFCAFMAFLVAASSVPVTDLATKKFMPANLLQFTNQEKWFCVVKDDEVLRSAVSLSNAQGALGEPETSFWGSRIRQAVIPMTYHKPGDPHLLPKTWTGGSMYWDDYSDIRKMQRTCTGHANPKANGCGTGWTSIIGGWTTDNFHDLSPCCNEHDTCYDLCHMGTWMTQEKCDDHFKRCMMKICANDLGHLATSSDRRQCEFQANGFHKLVVKFGGSAYEEAQQVSCATDRPAWTRAPGRRPSRHRFSG